MRLHVLEFVLEMFFARMFTFRRDVLLRLQISQYTGSWIKVSS